MRNQQIFSFKIAARKTYTVEEAAELMFNSDFSDGDSDFSDSGTDNESETEEEVFQSGNVDEQFIEIEFIPDSEQNNYGQNDVVC